MEEAGMNNRNNDYINALKLMINDQGIAALGKKLIELNSKDKLTNEDYLKLGDIIKQNQKDPRKSKNIFSGKLLIPPELGDYVGGHRTANAGQKAWNNRDAIIALWTENYQDQAITGAESNPHSEADGAAIQSEQQLNSGQGGKTKKSKEFGEVTVRGSSISKVPKDQRPKGSFASFNRDVEIVNKVGIGVIAPPAPVGIRTVKEKAVGDMGPSKELKSMQTLFTAMNRLSPARLQQFREYLDLPIGMRVVYQDANNQEKSGRIYVNYSQESELASSTGRTLLKVQTLHQTAISDLSSYLKTGRLTLEEKVSLMRDIAMGVQILHQEFKMTHRDLKPENILVYRDGQGRLRAKITDFGFLEPAEKVSNYWGTPNYSSPEALQIISEIKKNIRPTEVLAAPTDMYSLGITYFVLLTNQPPEKFPKDGDSWNRNINIETLLKGAGLKASPEKLSKLLAILSSLTEIDPKQRMNLNGLLPAINELS